ncbi:MAG: hypothetical protein ABIS18_03025 [Actinomycetota bacterium]
MVILASLIVGGALALRHGKIGLIGAIFATLGSAMFSAFAGPGIVNTQAASGTDFIVITGTLTCTLTVIISAIVGCQRQRTSVRS